MQEFDQGLACKVRASGIDGRPEIDSVRSPPPPSSFFLLHHFPELTLTRLTVPPFRHNALYSTVAKDDDYYLQSVTIFRKVKEEFSQACRENKFILRDFAYDEAAIEKQRKAFEMAGVEEKELWVRLLLHLPSHPPPDLSLMFLDGFR
jgi:hypothetical protein